MKVGDKLRGGEVVVWNGEHGIIRVTRTLFYIFHEYNIEYDGIWTRSTDSSASCLCAIPCHEPSDHMWSLLKVLNS